MANPVCPAFTSLASRSWFAASSNRRALNRAVVVLSAYSRRRAASFAYARSNFSSRGRVMRFGEDTRLGQKFDTEFLGVKRDAGGGSAPRLTGIPLLKGRLYSPAAR